MSTHQHVTEEVAETAALYALGLLSKGEKAAFELHLSDGYSVCELEISRCGDLVALWTDQISSAPPSELRSKLLARIRENAQPKSEERSPVLLKKPGIVALRASNMEWRPGPSQGLQVKVLRDDPQSDMVTVLLRMEAESRYPAHRHKGIEEVYVLEGHMQVEGIELIAGDFCVSHPESVHYDTYSPLGCLLMVKTSRHDEMLR